MSTLVWAIIALIVGAAVGAGAVWMSAVRRAGPMSVNEMKKENERFREEVNAHFVQTAGLINELTDSYKKVFDHLSDGAERLVDNEALRERMPQVGHSEVRLRHIGAPKDFSSGGGAKLEDGPGKPGSPTSGRQNSKSEGSKPKADKTPKSEDSKPKADYAPGGERKSPSGRV